MRTKQRGFFESYPLYYKTGHADGGQRLNARYECLIADRLEHIKGKTVLDVGSHDGRWSLAALSAGAARVIGVEPRADLVEAAEANLSAYNVTGAEFHVGDALEFLRRERPGDDGPPRRTLAAQNK